jgi:hypothetical protein
MRARTTAIKLTTTTLQNFTTIDENIPSPRLGLLGRTFNLFSFTDSLFGVYAQLQH